MKIKSIKIFLVSLPLSEAYVHATANVTALEEVFLRIELDDLSVGYSEVRGNGEYATYQTCTSVIEDLRELEQELLKYSTSEIPKLILDRSKNNLAAFLLEAGCLDAVARKANLPLREYLGIRGVKEVPTHAAISFTSPFQSGTLAFKASKKGFKRIKMRVGDVHLKNDLARIEAVRDRIGDSVELALDANGAWTAQQAVTAVHEMESFNIAWIEQPTPPHDLEALKCVTQNSPVKIVADESVRNYDDVYRIVNQNAAHGVHLKLEKCGTVSHLREMVDLAREANLFVEIGQMDQGRLGSSIIGNIAVVFTPDAYELWGFERVLKDVGKNVEVGEGSFRFSNLPGSGVDVELDDRYLRLVIS